MSQKADVPVRGVNYVAITGVSDEFKYRYEIVGDKNYVSTSEKRFLERKYDIVVSLSLYLNLYYMYF